MNYNEAALRLHKEARGKLTVETATKIKSRNDLATVYSPGVAAPCLEIAKNPADAYVYTGKGRTVAVVTDGSAVLGLGNIGPLASIPVMEGKCALLKEFAGVDAWPLALDTQDTNEIIATVRRIAPVFGGVNLEDIAAPRCFEIEAALQDLGIPVFHDDQHGTAIVTLAGLINAARVTNRELNSSTVVVAGAGAAGIAIIKLLLQAGSNAPANIILCDSKGLVHLGRDDLNTYKVEIAKKTNKDSLVGNLADALRGADIFVGVSAPDTVSAEMIQSMAADPVIFAMANPNPEIMPDIARAAGAAVVATGRSDFPNQVNNVLAFPGIFRGALDNRVRQITDTMKLAAATALAGLVENPTVEKILPDPFDPAIVPAVSAVITD